MVRVQLCTKRVYGWQEVSIAQLCVCVCGGVQVGTSTSTPASISSGHAKGLLCARIPTVQRRSNAESLCGEANGRAQTDCASEVAPCVAISMGLGGYTDLL